MKEIESDIRGIELTQQSKNTNYLALIVSGESFASILHNTLRSVIELKYDYMQTESVLLNVHLISHDEVIRINISLNETAKMLMLGIDNKTITYVFAAYPNNIHPVNLYGQYHAVSY